MAKKFIKYADLFSIVLKKVNIMAIAGKPAAFIRPPKDLDIEKFNRFMIKQGLINIIARDEEGNAMFIIPTLQYELVKEIDIRELE